MNSNLLVGYKDIINNKNKQFRMHIKHLGLTLICASLVSTAMASGYRIPENSIRSTALSSAYVANAQGADAAYHNPAAMVFNEDAQFLEASINYIYLNAIDFNGTMTSPLWGGGTNNVNESSEAQHFFIPSLHYTSEAYGNTRFGFSMTTPVGLTKRWLAPNTGTYSEKFSLKTIELNPSIAYQVSDNFSIAAGARALLSRGVIRMRNTITNYSRKMEGDSVDYGYNLALHFKPSDTVDLALTYRSKIDITAEGTATLTLGAFSYNNRHASLTVPSPAVLAIGAAFDLDDKTTLEIAIDQTYWSAYKQLDFNYDSVLAPANVFATFDAAQARNWKDALAYRIGLTHEYDDKWTLMGAYVFYETPVPEATLGVELPDSDAHVVSFGALYKVSNELTVGGSLLYDYKVSRNVNNSTINGEFTDAGATFITVGAELKF